MNDLYKIVTARPEHLPSLPVIERAAANVFSTDDLPLSLRNAVTPIAEFEEARKGGHLWVAEGNNGQSVGFVLVSIVDGAVYIDEMDVHPEHARMGIGRKFVLTISEWARSVGYSAVTLTTFRHILWNMPFYESCGFRLLNPTEVTPGLQERLDKQVRRGLSRQNRVAMIMQFQEQTL